MYKLSLILSAWLKWQFQDRSELFRCLLLKGIIFLLNHIAVNLYVLPRLFHLCFFHIFCYSGSVKIIVYSVWCGLWVICHFIYQCMLSVLTKFLCFDLFSFTSWYSSSLFFSKLHLSPFFLSVFRSKLNLGGEGL